jgi:uncharacterized protein YkwD
MVGLRSVLILVGLVAVFTTFLLTSDTVQSHSLGPAVGVRQVTALVIGADQSLLPNSEAPATGAPGAAEASGSAALPAPPPPPPPPPAPSWFGGTPSGGPPPVATGPVSTQHALINSDRAAAGLPALAWNGCLAGVAASNAQRMAAAGSISHADGPSRSLGCGLGSVQAGENVGYWTGGIDDGQLNQMFMQSPSHRANIMGPYRYVGTAWVVAPGGTAYIAVEFA